ncbi:hypothetical protein [Actinobacillus suis]|nr:hypothetical protein [Actinobacillus suis]MCQ9628671.1 hypothetical protein [Actinobacillus suis]MCQ9631394.1 hypothetical protein [Actinobacillus suis]
MNVLTAYFNTQLVNAGFPDDFEINWSLGYSQGDGMAFYGDIEHTYWLGLFQRIYPNQKRKYRKFERLTRSLIEWQNYGDNLISIRQNHFGYRYSHFNTMDLHAPSAADFRFFDEDAKKDWYFPTYKVGEYQALWDEFVADLAEYIRDLSKQLAQEGYRIIEATPYQKEVAYQFETQHYRIEFVTEPHEFYANHFETYMYDCDFEDVESLCKAALKGIKIANVYAQVLDKATGIALGEDYFGYLAYNKEDKTFGGYRYILIREAIKAARSKDGLISRQAQLMQKSLPHLHLNTNGN